MKVLAPILGAIGVASLDLNAPVLDANLMARVNAGPKSTWVAGPNRRFEGVTVGQAAKLLGTSDAPEPTVFDKAPVSNLGPPPTDFDSRDQWPGCIKPIRDQGNCGGCWAFGAAETLSDRFCIEGGANVTLSPQDLISCNVNRYNSGCEGGVIEYAWKYLYATGISTEACVPFVANDTACPTTCADGSPMKKYKASQVINFQGVDAAEQAVRQSGPLQVGFFVFQDFFAYKSGVYSHSGADAPLGKHSVKIVGYGTSEDGVKYWTVANSWGPEWGDGGYFKIERRVNMCSMEDMFTYGYAAV